MAELLVRTVAHARSGDALLDCKRSPVGAVIVICPDGWNWSQKELTALFWRIVKFPGLRGSDLAGFLAPDPDDGARTLRRWRFTLDLAALDAARTAEPQKRETLVEALAYRKTRMETFEDPRVIGGDGRVIG